MGKEKKKKNTTNKIIMALLVPVLLASTYALWYWANSVQDSLREVISLSTVSIEAAKQEKLQSMRKELRDAGQKLEQLYALAISEEDVPRLLNELEALGGESVQVFVRDVTINSDKLEASISFSGKFTDVTSVVKQVNEMPYALYASSVDIRRGAGANEEHDYYMWDASMRIVLPVLPEQQQ